MTNFFVMNALKIRLLVMDEIYMRGNEDTIHWKYADIIQNVTFWGLFIVIIMTTICNREGYIYILSCVRSGALITTSMAINTLRVLLITTTDIFRATGLSEWKGR